MPQLTRSHQVNDRQRVAPSLSCAPPPVSLIVDQTIPITVLTGFLGAGKTTLLNRLLKHKSLSDTAVLINEFGEVGLDHLLVEPVNGDVVLLNAGCLCCTVRGDLVNALHSLLMRRARGKVPFFKRVIVETTGLADPAPILHTLITDPLVAARYRLDGVVTVVDAANGEATLDAQMEAVKQAAVADRIVLTKSDLAAAPGIAGLRGRLDALNPGVMIIPASDGVIDPALILDLGPFRADSKAADVLQWLNEEAFAQEAPVEQHHHHDHHTHHDQNRHDEHIQAFCLTFDHPLRWEGFGRFLEMLVATRGESLLRVKGLLNLVGQDRPLVINGVQHIFHEPVLLPEWPAGDDQRSRLVFITRDLARSVIEDGIRAFEQAAAPSISPRPKERPSLARNVLRTVLAAMLVIAPVTSFAEPPDTIKAIGVENEYANVISQIGGKYVQVQSIETDPNTDPHTFEASPKVAREIAAAALIVVNGVGYDNWASKIISATSRPKRRVINVQQLLGLPDDTANPHLWYDPKTMPAVATAIAGDLAALDPAEATYFHTEAQKFIASLKPWNEAIAAFKAHHDKTPIAVTEPVADYMLQAMGFDILTPFSLQKAIMDGTDPSPQDVTLQNNLFAGHKVKVFAYNQQVTDALTRSFLDASKNAGIPVVGVYETMPTPGYTYQSWMMAEVSALEMAVTGKMSTQTLQKGH